MNKKNRAELIRAMDLLARSANDEQVQMLWLAAGVADGDIDCNTTDDDLSCYYEEDEDFSTLMETFLRTMSRAYRSGGLYCDRVVSK